MWLKGINRLIAAGAVVLVLAGTSFSQPFWDPRLPVPTGGTATIRPFVAAGPDTDMPLPPQLAQAPGGQLQAQAGEPPEVDESALRYFASRGDTRRLEIEIARLRALYPQWRPPADPLAVPVNVDEQLEAMWRLYSEGRLAEARRLIAERREAEPGWDAPADLLDRLTLSEARERIVNASQLQQFETVIRVASDNPHLLTCSEVDVLWRVAEAFARTERPGRARDAYSYILSNCDNPQERLATAQNAVRLLERPLVEDLLAMERFDEAGAGEFAQVRDDLARDTVAKGGEDGAVAVDNESLLRLQRLSREGDDASDPRLLGWYYLRRSDNAAAREWFALSMQREAGAEAAQGLALALMGLGDHAAAEDAAYPYRDAGEDNGNVYLAAAANLLGVEPRVALEAPVLARIVAKAAARRDVATGRQLGWYARAYGQHQTAGRWFAAALSWDPDDEPSAYGLALTRHLQGDGPGLAEIKRLWAGRSERIAAVGTPRAAQLAGAERVLPRTGSEAAEPRTRETADTGPAGSPAPARAVGAAAAQPRVGGSPQSGCTGTLAPVGGISAEAALSRGWCLMDRDRPHEAAQAFERALESASQATRRDGAYGQSLAYLRLGLADRAAVAAARAPQDSRRSIELQAAILAERALAFYEKGRYVEALVALDQRAQIAPERIDLMVLRGYAYLNLKRMGDAERVFKAAAGTGNRDAIRGLAEVRNSEL